ncbi:MAG: exodeoxyribonuclease VII small subunit [Rhodobacteraceae bacterium]|nr:exodeoxyribonuclease VII small subunit [Paracoccaceae bacterium]
MNEHEIESSPPDSNAIGTMTYEEALNQLESTISELEDGKAPLARTVELFERGCQLRDHCEKLLTDAQGRIDRIVATGSSRAV